MWALYKFQARVTFKSPSWLFGFIMPAMFLAIMAPMSSENITTVMANVITINMISSGLMAFGFTMFEYRKSVIMKRIGSTSISKPMALLGFFSWHSTMAFASVAWTFFLAYIMSSDVSGYYNSSIAWESISWGGVVWGIVFGIILSLAIGFMFVSISKNIEIFNMMTMFYFMFATFVGGLFFPSSTDPESAYAWMTYVGYLIPHTYLAQFLSSSFSTTAVMNAGATGIPIDQLGMTVFTQSDFTFVKNAVWDFSSGYAIVTEVGVAPITQEPLYVIKQVDQWKVILNFVVPVAAIGGAFGVSLKTFKWDN